MRLRTLIRLMAAASAASLAAGASLADPSARVGRIGFTEGAVSFQPPFADSWTDASRNFPVAPGESFWTGDGGRAQLQIGSVDVRLDNETELDVVDLGYGEMRLAMPQGSLDVRVWAPPRGGVIVATPAGDVRLDQRGLYRIDVGAPADDGAYPPVEVTVFTGEATAPSPEGGSPVVGGEAALLYAGYDPIAQDVLDAAIDDWGRDLEARERWQPRPGLSVAFTGFEDLEGAGDFVVDPQYGQVWFPRGVAADWAPYRYGHWAFVEPWGYTWIDDQPWGFAPFHYGRWALFGGRWGWIGGQVVAEPVYAPALVAFIGGVGWSVGGVEAIGWAPLAPDEIYRPPYQVSVDYLRQVNVTSVRSTIIENITVRDTIERVTDYRNASAVTVVRADAFTGAGAVHRARLPITADVIARAPPASEANRPTPTARARSGIASPAAGGPDAAPVAAARPPARLQAVRAAVVARPTVAGRPPVIAGARIAPPPSRAATAHAPVLIAPAQLHHPAAQGRAPPPRPEGGPTRPAEPIPPPKSSAPARPSALPAERAAPAGSERGQRAAPPAAAAPSDERRKGEAQLPRDERRPAAAEPAQPTQPEVTPPPGQTKVERDKADARAKAEADAKKHKPAPDAPDR